MSANGDDSGNFCYRHPTRQSYILCQRCGRTVCSSCQTQAAVGVHCPECVAEARQRAPKRKPAIVTAFRSSSSVPVVTYSIIGLNVLMYIAQLLSGGAVFQALAYWPPITAYEPWRMLSSAFLHSQASLLPLHILFNMYALYVLGPALERLVGRGRFIALYLIAAFGGSLAVLLLAPQDVVVGASGAIFGLFGAFFVIQRSLGGNSLQLVIIIGINLALGFFIPNIAWQAHVGGLLVGAAVAFVYLKTRRRDQFRWQVVAVSGIAIALIAVTIAKVTI